MAVEKALSDVLWRWTPDGVGHIDGEEVARFQKAIDRIEIDMVGVHVIRARPSQFAHGSVSGGARAGWLRAHYQILAVGFIPDRDDGNTPFGGAHAGGQLRLRLMRKAVTDTERIFVQNNGRAGHCFTPDPRMQ